MERLYDSELKVMEPLWAEGPQTAGALAKKLALVDKGAVARSDPGFLCTPLVTREEAQRRETEGLISRMFNGSKAQFLSSFLSEGLTPDEAAELRALIDKLE